MSRFYLMFNLILLPIAFQLDLESKRKGEREIGGG